MRLLRQRPTYTACPARQHSDSRMPQRCVRGCRSDGALLKGRHIRTVCLPNGSAACVLEKAQPDDQIIAVASKCVSGYRSIGGQIEKKTIEAGIVYAIVSENHRNGSLRLPLRLSSQLWQVLLTTLFFQMNPQAVCSCRQPQISLSRLRTDDLAAPSVCIAIVQHTVNALPSGRRCVGQAQEWPRFMFTRASVTPEPRRPPRRRQASLPPERRSTTPDANEAN